MNIDNFKSSFQSLSYNEGDNGVEFSRKIEGLVEQVRIEDQKDKQRIIGVSILAAGFGLAYGIMGIYNYLEDAEGTKHWGFLIYVLAILSFVPILIREYRRNKRISYDVTFVQFIENVEKRFALFQSKDLLMFPGFLILGVSVAFMISQTGMPIIKAIVIALLILIGASTVGFLVRLLVWRKKLLLREELRHIKESLQ